MIKSMNKPQGLAPQKPKRQVFCSKTYLKLAALSSLLLLFGCVSSPERKPETELEPGLARLQMQYSHRRPHLFKERLFGRIMSLNTASGENLFLDADYRTNAVATRFLDVAPGTYTLRAQCEPVIDYNEYPSIWMLNHKLTLQANETLTLECERFVIDEHKHKQRKWTLGERLLDQRNFGIRLSELSRNLNSVR